MDGHAPGYVRHRSIGVVSMLLLLAATLHAEVILQYFNTSYRELVYKMPELAEAGYQALWLPPPTKGSGGLSVGYDCWDPFDLGGKDQRGSVRTRYGTEAELLRLIEVAHRFGIRVYFDNIMNHRAFDVPGYNEYTPIDVYPGMVPEDFHLRVTEEGFYRKWDNVANWGDTWQVQNRNFSDLIDIAQESPDNGNFGTSEGDHIPKISLVRHPSNPEYYDTHPTLGWVGFGSTNITSNVISNNPGYYSEDVNAYLIRAVRWLVHHTKVDGLRLDAVKHVPAYFFGEQWAGNKDASAAGYCGQAQWQFDKTRGFIDTNNLRDTVFDTEATFGRNDLMMFGEHLGEPPSFGDYIAAGMRLVDSKLHGFLNSNLGMPWGNLSNLQLPGGEGFSDGSGVPYVKSHDDDYATRPELQFALNLTRRGLPNVYTDGNYQSETLGESGGAFPRHANIAFLGQFSDNRIPNLIYIHNHFARGDQWGRWGDNDVVAYDRMDKRENPSMSDTDGTVLFFVMNDDYSSGQYREIWTSFPVGAYLWQYSNGGGNFYYTVPWDSKIKVIVPPGGYFAFSWRNPEESSAWSGGNWDVHPVEIRENGQAVGWMSYDRNDGPDGDPTFNPYGAYDEDTEDFTYTWYVPRLTSPTNLDFIVRVDGSAENVLLKLDGGVNLNSTGYNPPSVMRDHPPGNEGSTAVFEGYEQMDYVQRIREKFAAADVGRNIIGSLGAESYECTLGESGFTINNGDGDNSSTDTAEWLYHEPTTVNEYGATHFWPPPDQATNTSIYLWAKMGYAGQADKMFVYYTMDGASYPEGSGGYSLNDSTIVQPMAFSTNGTNSAIDYWTCTLPAMDDSTVLRYKIGCYHHDAASVFPSNGDNVFWKKKMVTQFAITGFNAGSVAYYPHNDFGVQEAGLKEGFHMLRARAFLKRTGFAAIYNTFVQPFYYDAETPGGEIVYPAENAGLGQNSYEVVVRTDATVDDVWFHIDDADADNDDQATGDANGNGLKTNALGQATNAWVQANEVTPTTAIVSEYPNEWRFSYRNIPGGDSNATIRVRLLELSSSTNMGLSAAAAHVTELVRQVTANGPDFELFFFWPEQDGATVQAGWTIRVKFTQALGIPFPDDNDFRDRFLIRIDGYAQGQENYAITRGDIGGYGEIAYDLPDLYNGDPELLRHIEVTFLIEGNVTLAAHRYVKFSPGEEALHVNILYPPEYDSDGKAYEIVLPDVGNPDPEDRQITIRVETGLEVGDVWIEFTNSVGYTTPVGSITNPLAGTVSVVQGSNGVVGAEAALFGTVDVTFSNTLITGHTTLFSNELAVSNVVRVETNFLVVTQIVSDTELTISEPYPGVSATNLTVAVQSAFDTELSVGSTVVVGGHEMTIETLDSSSNLTLTAGYPGTTASGLPAYRLDANGFRVGNFLYWDFLWTNMTAGQFRFVAYADTNDNRSTVEGYDVRNARVILREMVDPDPDDYDEDDDGLYDHSSIEWGETAPMDLPDSNPETWVNGDVHVWRIYGRTTALLPDSDGDGLPDGLESGWRTPIDTNHTDITTDTDGDGYLNFIADLDPPFFNTVPDNGCGQKPGAQYCLPEFVFTAGRTDQIHGSMTDPNNPDSDYDGILDGVEDRNRNGWVDGDGLPLQPTTSNPWDDRPNESGWPDGQWDAGWASHTNRETDPNKSDTDDDGAGDGYGEDVNVNGWIEGDANSNRVWESGEFWQETDPLNPDTDGDGLPDGWERRYSFDPFDDGMIGRTNMQTGAAVTNLEHGANGNPDGDLIVVGVTTQAYVNIMEYQNGTNPRQFDAGGEPPEDRIIIGPGPVLGVLNGVTNYQEFMDWPRESCLALDEYEGGGNNNQLGDVYKGWDGWDESRDIVAFYALDGGDAVNGGDDRFYFRLDFHDLKALAEEGNLDLYVVIDTGNPASGEVNLPDDVDTETEMLWEMVVAVYQSGSGRVYLDLDRTNNTTSVGQNLYSHGVVPRDQNAADGFVDAYFSAGLDAVEFAISRQALKDAGWSGLASSNFNYQVFTTKDGTANSPVGAGDIGGRSDIRDAVYNDGIAEDYWQAQESLESVLTAWIPGSARAGRAKVAMVAHGNQAIQPGSTIQDLVNTDAGAGYDRPLAAHELFRQPLNLHITPTLASAIEWAAADPAAGKPWRDGPALNRRVAALIDTNVVTLLGSAFADHILPYFTPEFNEDNEALARDFLETIYDCTIDRSQAVFWTPERVLDADTFSKIAGMGYGYTLLDQETHLFNWYGRTESLIDGGYRINLIDGIRAFVINNLASTYRFENHDGGTPMALRALFSRKARSGIQDQVVTLLSNWEDFTDNDDADAYDRNIRWLANRPWTALVALEQIAAGEVDAWGDEAGDMWGTVSRSGPGTDKQAYNWVNHAAQEDFDNWYLGQTGVEEGLHEKIFEIRPGVPVTNRYGMLYTPGSMMANAWSAVSGIAHPDVKRLARAAIHASVFETAFHSESNNDLRRYSTGDYMSPATDYHDLADFARVAQSQTRLAAVYAEVDDWAVNGGALIATQIEVVDADMDGEDEYLLYNRRLLALFERIGGRLVGAWVRDLVGGGIYQAVGNPAGYAGSETEREGAWNVNGDGTVEAHRTSGLKDWYALYNPPSGTPEYVNKMYEFTDLTNGWRMVSDDTFITKTVTLAANAAVWEVQYVLSGGLADKTLYVRHGLSPHLADLQMRGQGTLGDVVSVGGVLTLVNTNYGTAVTATIGYGDAGHTAAYKADAVDEDTNIVDFTTVPMRNQAQTHQVELYGTGSFSFAIGFSATGADYDGDLMPNLYEDGFGFLNAAYAPDGTNDYDHDGVINAYEYIANTSPSNDLDYLHIAELGSEGSSTGIVVRFPAKTQREYRIWYRDNLLADPAWSNATLTPITVPTNMIVEWLDDGSATDPDPASITSRFYRIDVSLP